MMFDRPEITIIIEDRKKKYTQKFPLTESIWMDIGIDPPSILQSGRGQTLIQGDPKQFNLSFRPLRLPDGSFQTTTIEDKTYWDEENWVVLPEPGYEGRYMMNRHGHIHRTSGKRMQLKPKNGTIKLMYNGKRVNRSIHVLKKKLFGKE
jgi:hypothetical protein